jgi:hypothetical protein
VAAVMAGARNRFARNDPNRRRPRRRRTGHSNCTAPFARLHDRNGASSRKKCDVRQKYISQFHERPPAAPGDPLIIVESRLKSVSVWLQLIEIDIRLPVLRPKRLIEKEKLYEVARVRP